MNSDLIIIGSGPAGLTAAIYAARANLNPVVIAGTSWGGQLMTTTEVENYPGFIDGVLGPELMERMLKQAEKFGAKIVYENATRIEKKDRFFVFTHQSQYLGKSVIIATGATPKKLGIKGEDEFWGKGVSSCATCDGAFFKNKVVAVIGGGDSAMEESTFLTRFASKVFIIHRKAEFRASKIMQERAKRNPKIEIILNSIVKEVQGESVVKNILIENVLNNEQTNLAVDGLFLAIGHIPITDFLGNQIELTETGYIKSVDGIKTSVEGIFVAGDVEDYKYRQAITAAGAGCKAALEAEKWLAGH